MIETIEYTCKFCHTKRAFECEMFDTSRLGIDLKKWIPALCCNRCGQFQSERRRQTEAISRACYLLILARKNEDRKPVDLNKFRDAFNRLTMKFATLVCEYHRFETVHEPEFVNQLMEQPFKANTILATYANGIARMPR